jgi:hypothetical protein
MKLGAVCKRAKEAHGIDLDVDPKVYEAIADRCKEVESGARNVDHILRGTVLPLVSSEILTRLAAGDALANMRCRSRRTAPSSAPREGDDVSGARHGLRQSRDRRGGRHRRPRHRVLELDAGHRPAAQVVHAADRRA